MTKILASLFLVVWLAWVAAICFIVVSAAKFSWDYLTSEVQ